MGNFVAGLDIGTTKIACIIAEDDDKGGMKVLGVGVAPSLGLRKGVVVNIEKTVQGIKKAVKDAELMAGFDIEEVYVGIAGEHVKSYNNSGAVAISENGEITEEDVDRAIESASAIPNLKERDTLHVVPQKFVVDDQIGIKDPIGMSGVRLETYVHIITGSVTSAQNINKSVELAGLSVKELVLEPYASSFSVLETDEKEIGVALVDMGGGTTDVALYIEDALAQTAVVGVGGEYVTKDIAMGIRTPIEKAEEIKKKYGSADLASVPKGEEFPVPGVGGREERQVSCAILSSIVQPRVEEILSLVAREIENSGLKDMLGAGIVLTGGGSLLEGIREVAERVFKLPVKLGVPQGFSGIVDMAKSPIQATGIGLCMYGLEQEKKAEESGQTTGSSFTFADLINKVKEFYNRFM
jgi:cell division protein FtsA